MQHKLKNIQLILLMCFVATMPFNTAHFNYNSFSIILLGAHTIASIVLNPPLKPYLNALFISFISFYILYAIGYVYSENKEEAGLLLERKLSLIVFPIILFSTSKYSFLEVKKILLSFVFSCIAVCIICVGMASYFYFTTHNADIFYYHDLSKLVGMHAAYLSLHLCFSLFILFFLFYQESKTFNLTRNIIYYSSIGFLVVMIVALSSRTQIILMILGMITYVIYRFRLYTSKLKLIISSIVFVFVLASLILLSPRVRERFKAAVNYNQEFAMSKKWGEQQMRFLIWNSALDLIIEKPVFGTGIGDVQDDLQNTYVKQQHVSLTYFPNTRFNAHNQFLEITIALGFLGLFVFITGAVLALKHALKHRNIFYFLFMGLFFISCITESMLERQNGIVFFAFFNSFLILNNITENLNKTD